MTSVSQARVWMKTRTTWRTLSGTWSKPTSIEACCASNDANQCPGRYMGGEKGGSKSQFPYSLPTTKFSEFRWGQRRNWCVLFSPVIPSPDFASKTFLGDITFSQQSIREPANSSKTHPPLLVCIGLDSVGVSATWVHFQLIPVNAGHAVNIPHTIRMGGLTNHLW